MRVVARAGRAARAGSSRRSARRRPPSAAPRSSSRSFIQRARHIEVQILGDQHGNLVHLLRARLLGAAPASEGGRDRPGAQPRRRRVRDEHLRRRRAPGARGRLRQRRHRRVPASTPTPASSTSSRSTRASRSSTRSPRWSPASTSCKARSCIAQGAPHRRPGDRPAAAGGDPPQRLRHAVPRHDRGPGEQLHARLRPDHRTIARPAAWASGSTPARPSPARSITPFYDSLLVKVTAWAPTLRRGRRRAWTAPARVPHPRREDEHPVPRQPGHAPDVPAPASYTTRFIDETPELFQFAPRRDRATKLLTYLGDVIVNGNPEVEGPRRAAALPRAAPCPALDPQPPTPPGTRDRLQELGPGEVRRAGCASRSGCCSPTRRSATRTSRCWPRGCAPTTCCASPAPTTPRSCPSCSRWRCGAGRRSTSRCGS